MRIPERKEKEKGSEIIFKAIMVRNFPNLGRETDIQIHEVQRIPNRLTLNRVHRATLYLNCQKSKPKNFKSGKRRESSYVQGNLPKTSSGFLRRNFSGQERKEWPTQHTEGKDLSTKNPIPDVFVLQKQRREKDLYKQKLKEFITTRLAFQGVQKGVLCVEVKEC